MRLSLLIYALFSFAAPAAAFAESGDMEECRRFWGQLQRADRILTTRTEPDKPWRRRLIRPLNSRFQGKSISSGLLTARGESVLDRRLSPAQADALERAYFKGMGETGKDSGSAWPGNYTAAQIRAKMKILKEAFSSPRERRALVREVMERNKNPFLPFFPSLVGYDVLKRSLSQMEQDAVEAAYHTSLGERGKNGSHAWPGNYTPAQLREKVRILKEAFPSQSERELLIKFEERYLIYYFPFEYSSTAKENTRNLISLFLFLQTLPQSQIQKAWRENYPDDDNPAFEHEAKAYLLSIVTAATLAQWTPLLINGKRILGRVLSAGELTAVMKARKIGQGKPGEGGSPARPGNSAAAQLRAKTRILRKAFTDEKELRLIRDGSALFEEPPEEGAHKQAVEEAQMRLYPAQYMPARLLIGGLGGFVNALKSPLAQSQEIDMEKLRLIAPKAPASEALAKLMSKAFAGLPRLFEYLLPEHRALLKRRP